MRRLLSTPLLLTLVACASAKAPPPAPPRAPRVTAFLPVPPACDKPYVTSFDRDASWLVSSCDTALEVRDASTGWVTAQRSLDGHNAQATLSRDGSLVAHSVPGAVQVRDRATLSLKAELRDSEGGGRLNDYRWDFSPDNRRIAVAFGTGPIIEATLASGKIAWQVNDVRAMPGLRYLGAGGALCVGFGSAFVAGKPQDLPWFKQVRGYSSFNDDGSRLVTGDAHDFKVLDTTTGATLASIDNYPGGELRWYGKQVGSGVSKLELISPEHPEQRLTLNGSLSNGQETPDGSRLRGIESGTLVEWQLTTTPIRRQLAWSYHVPRYRTRPAPLADGGTVDWWRDPSDNARGLSITAKNGVARRLLFDQYARGFGADPQKPRVAVLFENSIAIYDTNTLQLLHELKAPEGVKDIALTPRGDLAVLSQQQLKLLNPVDGSQLAERQLPGAADPYGLKFSPDGRYWAFNSGFGSVIVMSEAGPVALLQPSRPESFAFSADSRLIHLLFEDSVASFELSTGKEVARRKPDFICPGEVQPDTGLWCTTPTGEVSAPPNGPPHAISAPRLAYPRVLDYREQELRMAVPAGELLRWRAPELEASVVMGLPIASDSVVLSPDGATLSDRARLYDALTGSEKGATGGKVHAWAADGDAYLDDFGAVWPKQATTAKERVTLPDGFRAIAFVGNAQTLLLQKAQDSSLFLLQPGQAPLQVAKEGELAAQSRDQRVTVLRSDHGRSLAVLKAPKVEPVLPTLAVGGALHVAVSDDGRLLAFVDESNTLEVRDLSAPKAAGRRYFLRDAPGVFGISFDPSGRFVLLHGLPLRFVRLNDGEILNLYVGYLDHIKTVTSPLLFVSEHDELEGDAALAQALFCDSRPEGTAEPCRLPERTPGIVRRFFGVR